MQGGFQSPFLNAPIFSNQLHIQTSCLECKHRTKINFMKESFLRKTAVTNQNAELRQAFYQTGFTLQRDQVVLKGVQDKVSELKAEQARLYN